MKTARNCFLILLVSTCCTSRAQVLLQPASVSCDARFSAPCARTNSEWLAVSVANDLNAAAIAGDTLEFNVILDEINSKAFNRDSGFYPFVLERNTALCVAHGANPTEFVGQTLTQIFDKVGITYTDAEALHERFRNATNEWVQYLWSDGGRVNSKLAFVIPISTTHYLGVGYENEPLPPDEPCSDNFDSWCSLTNVRSLVGQAQFRLSQAHSLEAFEQTLFRISFDDNFKIPGGFYLFMYHFDGELVAHGRLRDSFGKGLPEILPEKQLGSHQDGVDLHNQFVEAVQSQTTTWVQYPWRNSLEEDPYTKIAFLVKVEFGGDQYYLGAGFNFEVDDYLDAPLGEPCSDEYNLPCSFRTAYQLSSHTLSHGISSPLSVQERFQAITREGSFKHTNFYVFVYNFDNVCVAHGRNQGFVGLSLNEVFEEVGIDLNATQLHEQFRSAAKQGGGWVLYDWKSPGDATGFEKISYIFQINIDGVDYYGGIGFNHRRAPVQLFSEKGTKKNGDLIVCSAKYGLECSEVNARAILGQALAEFTLSSSEASAVTSVGGLDKPIEDIFAEITSKSSRFTVNDFSVSVFSFENNPACATKDESGCGIAHGSNPSYQGLTWNQILELEEVSSIQGANLHQQLVDQSNSGGGVVLYPFKGSAKRAWTARFRHDGESYYVVAEYLTTDLPETCDACTKGKTECTRGDQEFCEPIPDPPITEHPAFITTIVLLAIGIPFSYCMFRRQKHNGRLKRQAIEDEMKKMAECLEQQMQGMFQVMHDMPIRSPDEYERKVGVDATDKSKRNQAARWFWYENDARVSQHIEEMVLPDTNFVSYSGEICGQIEHAYQLYKEGLGFNEFRVDLTNKITSTATGKKLANIDSGNFYEIHFEKMKQSNANTGYERSVHREEIQILIASELFEDLPLLPTDIDFTSEDKEHLLPTYTGQIIQVSKVHSGNEWMFGNVLYDPLMDDAVRSQQGDAGLNAVLANALHDRPTSGWFPRCVVDLADAKQMHKLLNKLGGDGSDTLALPGSWDESKEGRIRVNQGTTEYDEVVNYFLAALYGQRDKTQVESVHRIQNVPLWQSYAVKRQTMKARYSKDSARRVNNKDTSMDGLERRWLFHGTQHDVMPKIEKQGFNRSFAGKNAVAYGRGVYFARDASYSSHRAYSVPDSNGIQHMFMCSVAVGDWSKGGYDQITPDPKPYNQFELFDSTVDNVSNPSIYVIYHDSQSYPEYLVSFKKCR